MLRGKHTLMREGARGRATVLREQRRGPGTRDWRQYVDAFPGHEWDYCYDVNTLKGRVISHPDGDSHYVDTNGVRHWSANQPSGNTRPQWTRTTDSHRISTRMDAAVRRAVREAVAENARLRKPAARVRRARKAA